MKPMMSSGSESSIS